MIQDAQFYKLPVSYTQLVKPILPSDGIVSDEYMSVTVAKVKCSRDMEQSIVVPMFEDYADVNMVRLGSDYYWITSYDTATYQDGSVRFSLMFAAVTTGFNASSTITAMWSRAPLHDKLQLFKANYSATELKIAASEELAKMYHKHKTDQQGSIIHSGMDPSGKPMFWVQVTTTSLLKGTPLSWVSGSSRYEGSYYDLAVEADYEASFEVESDYQIYGFFAVYSYEQPFDSLGNPEKIAVGPGATDGYGSTYHLTNAVTQVATDFTDVHYPTLYDVVNNCDSVLGIPASSIVDISVSEWCPYTPYLWLNDAVDLVTHLPGGDSFVLPGILRFSNYGMVALYQIDWPSRLTLDNSLNEDGWGAHTLKISPAEVASGSIQLQSVGGSPIFTVPNSWFSPSLDGTEYELTYYAKTFAGVDGLNTKVGFCLHTPPTGTDPWEEFDHIITIPEGKLPYVGDSWYEYVGYQRAMDREELRFARSQADDQLQLGIASALIGGLGSAALNSVMDSYGLVAGNPTRGGTLGGIVNAYAQRVMIGKQLSHDQAMKTMQARMTQASSYHNGYGVGYCDSSNMMSSRFVILMPSGLLEDDDLFDDMAAHIGIPYEGYATLDLSEIEGQQYLEGYLDPGSNPFHGPRADLLADTLAAGFRALVFTEPLP